MGAALGRLKSRESEEAPVGEEIAGGSRSCSGAAQGAAGEEVERSARASKEINLEERGAEERGREVLKSRAVGDLDGKALLWS